MLIQKVLSIWVLRRRLTIFKKSNPLIQIWADADFFKYPTPSDVLKSQYNFNVQTVFYWNTLKVLLKQNNLFKLDIR